MIILRSNHYGTYPTVASSALGHLRPIDNDIGIVNELRSSVLHDVGRRLDKSSNSCYICDIQLPGGDQQGEK